VPSVYIVGPVCYRKNGHLAVTDANLQLGRIQPDLFPAIFGEKENEPLDAEGTRSAFEALTVQINESMRGEQQVRVLFIFHIPHFIFFIPHFIFHFTYLTSYFTSLHFIFHFTYLTSYFTSLHFIFHFTYLTSYFTSHTSLHISLHIPHFIFHFTYLTSYFTSHTSLHPC
jgi:hypothetical protein